MSLMNEMLRDLDHARRENTRHANNSADNFEKEGAGSLSLADSGMLAPASIAAWVPALIAFLVVAGLLFLQQSNISVTDSVGASVGANTATKNTAQTIASVRDTMSSEGNSGSGSAEHNGAALLTPNYYPKLLASMQPIVQTPKHSEQLSGHKKEKILEEKKLASIAKNSNTKISNLDANSTTTEEISVNNDLKAKALETTVLKTKDINELLRAARVALSLDRLLSPIEDNAYSRYREVLLLQPNHKLAKAGLRSIARRYIHLAKGYYKKGNKSRAKVLLARAETVMPEDSEIQMEIMQAQEMFSVASPVSSLGPAITKSVVTNTAKVIVKVPAISISPAVFSSVKSVAHSTDPKPSPVRHVKETSNPLLYDRRVSQQARNLYKKGRADEAFNLLKGVVEQNPDAKNSFDTLVHLLIESDKTSEAQYYLDTAKHLSQSNNVEYQARILLSQKRTAAALELLEKQRLQVKADFSYRALLAGLYNKQGHFESSVDAYKSLLREGEDKTEYWLGLAIALDSLKRDEAALKAFYRARDPRQSEKVRRYIAARIQGLSS